MKIFKIIKLNFIFLTIILLVTPFIYDTNLFLVYELPKLLFFKIVVELWIIYLLIFDKGFLNAGWTFIRNNYVYILLVLAFLIIEYFNSGNRIAFIQGTYYKNFGLFTILHIIAFSVLVRKTIKEYGEEFINKISVLFGFGVILMFLFTIYQSFLTQILSITEGRWVGTFGQPNFLAAFILFTLPFLVENKDNMKSTKHKIFYCSSIIFSLIIIYFSQSRVVLVMGLLYLLYKLISYLKITGLFRFRSLVFIFLSSFMFLFLLINSRIVKVGLEEEFRFTIWNASFQIIKEYPITGVGLDNIVYYLPEALNKVGVDGYTLVDRSHNEIIDWFIYIGVPGTFFLIYTIYRYVRRFNFEFYDSASKIYKAVIISLLFWLCYSMVNNNGIWNYIWIAFLLGIIGAFNCKDRSIEIENSKIKKFKIMTVLIFVILLMQLLIDNGKQYLADKNFKNYINTENFIYLNRSYELRSTEEIYWQYLIKQKKFVENKNIQDQNKLYPDTKSEIDKVYLD
ncbi:O-antigen ligase family protein [Candidatus Dojkabacteria bacterium]|nr:O-antigen ligase family protein [Candidatus Dojkabacteria bacterium]